MSWERQNRKRAAAEAVEEAKIESWKSKVFAKKQAQRSEPHEQRYESAKWTYEGKKPMRNEQTSGAQTYTKMAREEKANRSDFYYEDVHRRAASSSSSSPNSYEQHSVFPENYIHSWVSEEMKSEYQDCPTTDSKIAILERKIAAMEEGIDEIKTDQVQFHREVEATIDFRTQMRWQRAQRNEKLQAGAEDLRLMKERLREQFERRGASECEQREESEVEYAYEQGYQSGIDSVSDDHVREERTKTWSVWLDELEGPYVSRDGREYMLARDKSARSRTMWKLFTEELQPYTSADGREYVVIVYTE
ncbi:hypothetical protein ACMFMF_004386 [Clarireedia jacksonii]